MGLNNDGAEAIAEKLRGLKEKQARTGGEKEWAKSPQVGKRVIKKYKRYKRWIFSSEFTGETGGTPSNSPIEKFIQ